MRYLTLTWLAAVFQILGFAATGIGAFLSFITLADPLFLDMIQLSWQQEGPGKLAAYWGVFGLLTPVLAGLGLLALGGVLRVAQRHGEWLEAE